MSVNRLSGVLPRLVFAVLWMLVVTCATADSDDFMRGYVQGLLDDRFPVMDVRIQKLETESAFLSARACLGPSQKREIERLLAKNSRIKHVNWDEEVKCETSSPEREVSYEILPEHELFAPLVADPRQPRFSMSYQRYHTPRDVFSAASVAFGEYFGVASEVYHDAGVSQIGIQAAVFALFNLDAPSSDLVNADYWIGIPLSYRKGPRSYLLRFYHQSSHLGDEFLLGNPGVNRVNLSYESAEFLGSYEWERLRLYAGGSYIIHSEPDLSPWQAHGGGEYLFPHAIGTFDFVAAVDVRASEELDWKRSSSFQAGFELHSSQQRRARLMMEYFSGYSPNGQFYLDRLRYVGMGLYFGF